MIVGLSQRVIYHNGQAYDSTDQAWYHYFKDQEIIPIPNRIDQDFKQLANKIDATDFPLLWITVLSLERSSYPFGAIVTSITNSCPTLTHN